MSLSVVVPVLNEADLVRHFIPHFRQCLPEAEMVIVDGGSCDGTLEELEAMRALFDLKLRFSTRGRARQLNAGARAASGDTLLFLHADSRLPEGCGQAMANLLRDERFAGGCFQLRFPRPDWIYRISDSLGNVAVDLSRIALGDHGIFCRRHAFQASGGFPDVPLMEDAEFYRALQRQGRVRQVRSAIVTSPRRYEACGPLRTTLFYIFILLTYLVGVDKERLACWHRRFTRSKRTPAGRLAFFSSLTKALPSLGYPPGGRPALP